VATWSGISVFKVNADLSLTPVSGSPFGDDLQPLALTPDGKLLLAWSDTDISIHSFRVEESGVLQEIFVSPMSRQIQMSDQIHSLTMHPSGNFAYDRNFVNSLTERLQLLGIDAVTGQVTVTADVLAPGRALEDPIMHPSGRFLYKRHCGVEILDTCFNNPFQIASDGTLTEVMTSFDINERVVAFDPTGQFAYALTQLGQMKVYAVDQATGRLTAINVSSSTDFALGTPVVSN
jgi:6-phosphogluconolactonase (cycloisomerase 2 family)